MLQRPEERASWLRWIHLAFFAWPISTQDLINILFPFGASHIDNIILKYVMVHGFCYC